MGVYIALVTIKTGEGYSSPGHPVTLSDDDAAGLRPFIREPREGELFDILSLGNEGEGAPSGETPPGLPDGADGSGDNDGDDDQGGGENRVEAIKAALDLLDAEADFVKTGARAGKPKIDPLAAVLGFKPDEVEIDAALALRETV